ncbi:hypothetical protein AVEN_39671-1 [Araneus ventricosus]|uniref:Uncharacterized protein n=1 Tax=Araneus ventricosus TaxID=182803 RepID=A0A4Y2W925_ARAVE|nr:hypothetical protein AVEN_39671-1 [Araneus ventricosus]
MDPSCQMTTLLAGGGGIMVWGMFFWSTLGTLIFVDTTLYITAYLNIVANHVHSFMVIMFPYGDGHFQQDRTPPNVLVPDVITATEPVEWTWDLSAGQCTVLDRSQIGLRNINQSLIHGQLSPLTSIL